MTVRENHLLFDWRREVREWERGRREGGMEEGCSMGSCEYEQLCTGTCGDVVETLGDRHNVFVPSLVLPAVL